MFFTRNCHLIKESMIGLNNLYLPLFREISDAGKNHQRMLN